MSRQLSHALAQGLQEAGIRRMFGMPGGGPNLDMIGCAQELGIEFVLAHGETAACIMAASYGRLTGTAGVAVVTRGPGLTSAANGLAQATLDRFPLLLVSDTVSSAHAGRTAHQRLDQVAAAAPLTKYSGILGTRDPVQVVTAAARLACAGPAGAVHLAFDPTVPGDPAPTLPAWPASDGAALQEARQLLSAARRPVILIGLDGARHGADVRAALAAVDCPVLVTYQAKGTVPESWPSYAGLFTGAAVERPVLEQSDLILGIGLDPVEPMPGPWPYTASTVLLHSQPAETGYFGTSLALVGAYRELLPTLLEGGHHEWEPAAGQLVRRRDQARLDAPPQGLSPHDVVRTTQQLLPGAAVTVDAGAHMLVVMPLWETDEADSVLISNGLATMGFALPAAIATALAQPGRRVVCFTGDGGLAMVLGELETLVRLQLDVTVVVFNDSALSLIQLKQGDGQGGAGAVRYGPTDFSRIAAATGLAGAVATDLRSLRTALSLRRQGPWLVDARVNPSSYQHVLRVTRG